MTSTRRWSSFDKEEKVEEVSVATNWRRFDDLVLLSAEFNF